MTQELQDRRQRVEKLEAKFAVVSTKKKSVYDEEEPKSQAYYVIKVAQQRQELQATGDRLDGENHRLQKEVRNTMFTLFKSWINRLQARHTMHGRGLGPLPHDCNGQHACQGMLNCLWLSSSSPSMDVFVFWCYRLQPWSEH